MRVVLAATHQMSVGHRVPLHRCLGVLALAAALECRGIDCSVLDLVEHGKLVEHDLESALERIVDIFVSSKPDVLGFSTMSNNLAIAIEVSRRVKERLPDTHIIMGGPGVSFCAVETLEAFNHLDSIIRGEADVAFPDFIESLRVDDKVPIIPGLVIRGGNQIIDNGWPEPIRDLDSLPVPLYEKSQLEPHDEENAVHLEVGRGCPYNCIFCSTSNYFKRKFRVKSVDRVLEEMTLIQNHLPRSHISFSHDLFTFSRDYVERICEALGQHEPRASWGCSGRLDTVDAVLLRTMRDAGCFGIFLGIEVGTERMQKIIRKRLDLSRLIETVGAIVELDLRCTLSFIIGLPDEREEDIEALFSWIFKSKAHDLNKVRIQIHLLTPEPGSRLFEEFKDLLVYDEYGSPGSSDIPANWTNLRSFMQEHPLIFPAYFYIPAKSISRKQALTFVFIGEMIQAAMTCSLNVAFSHLGDKLPKQLVASVSRLEPPTAESVRADRVSFMESIREIILELFEEEEHAGRMYDAVAQYEIAVNAISKRRTPDHIVELDVWFDPLQIIERVMGDSDDGTELKERRRTLAVAWDEKDEKVKSTEAPDAFSRLF
ncbi:MAG: B12-binding domain-containing radical SAM protein [Candidatus Thorarchaeota archaeon]